MKKNLFYLMVFFAVFQLSYSNDSSFLWFKQGSIPSKSYRCSPDGKYIAFGGNGMILDENSDLYLPIKYPKFDHFEFTNFNNKLSIIGLNGNDIITYNIDDGQISDSVYLSLINYSTNIRFTLDRKFLLSQINNYSISLAGTEHGDSLGQFNSFNNLDNYIYAYDVSPDDKYLIMLNNSQISIWDFKNQTLVNTFSANGNTNTSMQFTPDGKKIVLYTNGTKISDGFIIYDFNTKELIKTIKSLSILDYKISNDSKYLYFLDIDSLNNKIRICKYNLDTSDSSFCDSEEYFNIQIGFSFDIITINNIDYLLVYHGGNLELWDINTGKFIKNYFNNFKFYNYVNDNNNLVLSNGSISIYNIGTGENLLPIDIMSNCIYLNYNTQTEFYNSSNKLFEWDLINKINTDSCYLPTNLNNIQSFYDAKHFLFHNNSKQINYLLDWETKIIDSSQTLYTFLNPISKSKYIRSGKNGSHQYSIYNILTGKFYFSYTIGSKQLFIPDNEKNIYFYDSTGLNKYDIESETLIHSYFINGFAINLLKFIISPDENYFIGAFDNNSIEIYDLKNESKIDSFNINMFATGSGLYLSPNQQYLCVIYSDNSIAVFKTGMITSVKETRVQTDNFKIYPNPANDNVTIAFSLNPAIEKSIKAELFNSLGIKVRDISDKIQYDYNNMNAKINFSVSDLPVGIYFIGINDNKTKKMVGVVVGR